MAAQLVPLAPTEVRRDPVASVEAAVPPMPVVQAAPPDQKNQPPKEVFELAAAVSPGAGDAERNRFAQIVRDASTQKTTKINSDPIWEGVVISLLRGNLSDAWKFYNGGPVREEIMTDALGNRIGFKQFNARGATNVYRHIEDGREMTQEDVKKIAAAGGAITDSDKKALQTAGWVSARENAELARRNLNAPIFGALANANKAAITAGSANRNIEEQIAFAKDPKNREIIDYFSTLKPEERQRIFGFYSRLNAIGSGRQTGAEQRFNAQAGGMDQRTRGASGQVGTGATGPMDGGAAPTPGIAPAAGKISGALSTSASTLGQTNFNLSGGEGATSNISSNRNLQEQQNIETAIMDALQGRIKSAQQFKDFGRFLALDAENQKSYAEVPKEALPPGYVSIPEVDPRVSGYESIVSNRITQLRNNALLAAWNNEVYKAARQIANTGEALDMEKISDQFKKSDIFKAINNTYGARLEYELTGKKPDFPKGTLRVDRSNRVIRHDEDK